MVSFGNGEVRVSASVEDNGRRSDAVSGEKKSDLAALDLRRPRQHIRRFVESLHGTPGDHPFLPQRRQQQQVAPAQLARDYCKRLPPEEWDRLIKIEDDVATTV
ncbi:MAG: hypothetical protein WKH64_16945 [Chloroflexia bacterium]